jgi:hypothetical protein
MAKFRAVEPEGQKRRIDDDVEGHSRLLRATGDDDVEGHRKGRAVEDDVEGHRKGRVVEDDVEGHRKGRVVEDDVEGHSRLRATGDDDDTEGHMIGNPLLNQQLARAREQDIQRNLRAHETRSEASRPHKK